MSNIYISPDKTITNKQMAPLFLASPTIILGVLNAKSPIWNSQIVNQRG